jgi:hypothetical protein
MEEKSELDKIKDQRRAVRVAVFLKAASTAKEDTAILLSALQNYCLNFIELVRNVQAVEIGSAMLRT